MRKFVEQVAGRTKKGCGMIRALFLSLCREFASVVPDDFRAIKRDYLE
jgi:hypothetical protein